MPSRIAGVRERFGSQLRVLGAATAWMIAGRASGLVWTVLAIALVGVEHFGLYATACAVAAIIIGPLDNVFLVRSVRVAAEAFERERSARVVLGVSLVLVGIALYATFFVQGGGFTADAGWGWFIIGYALTMGGSELVFNAVKSQSTRDGRPNSYMRMDAVRQVSSVVCATAVMLSLGDDASIATAGLGYLLPYLVVIAAGMVLARRARPALPPRGREWRVLFIDAFVFAAYSQADILLLGVLFNQTVVGTYSMASQLVTAASVIGFMFGEQYLSKLREHRGAAAAGAPMWATWVLGGILVTGAYVLAGVIWLLPEYREIGVALAIIAPFAGLRAVSNTWVTALYVQGADAARVVWSSGALALRLGLLTVMWWAGLPGIVCAGVAAVVAELALVIAYRRLVVRDRSAERTVPIGETA